MESIKNPEEERKQLVFFLKNSQAVHSPETENAFAKVKRENFVPAHLKDFAYADEALPIGFDQTISQPSTIAASLELLKAKNGMKVGEVGSGCGYVAALLGEIVGEKGIVIACEIVKELAERSAKTLLDQGYKQVKVMNAEGVEALSKHGPFDRIIVSAACPFVPKPLFDALNEGGVVVAPVGDQYTQSLTSLTKIKGKPIKEEYMQSQFMFVPLGGKHGFQRFQ